MHDISSDFALLACGVILFLVGLIVAAPFMIWQRIKRRKSKMRRVTDTG
jgi:hypothetical protein